MQRTTGGPQVGVDAVPQSAFAFSMDDVTSVAGKHDTPLRERSPSQEKRPQRNLEEEKGSLEPGNLSKYSASASPASKAKESDGSAFVRGATRNKEEFNAYACSPYHKDLNLETRMNAEKETTGQTAAKKLEELQGRLASSEAARRGTEADANERALAANARADKANADLVKMAKRAETAEEGMRKAVDKSSSTKEATRLATKVDELRHGIKEVVKRNVTLRNERDDAIDRRVTAEGRTAQVEEELVLVKARMTKPDCDAAHVKNNASRSEAASNHHETTPARCETKSAGLETTVAECMSNANDGIQESKGQFVDAQERWAAERKVMVSEYARRDLLAAEELEAVRKEADEHVSKVKREAADLSDTLANRLTASERARAAETTAATARLSALGNDTTTCLRKVSGDLIACQEAREEERNKAAALLVEAGRKATKASEALTALRNAWAIDREDVAARHAALIEEFAVAKAKQDEEIGSLRQQLKDQQATWRDKPVLIREQLNRAERFIISEEAQITHSAQGLLESEQKMGEEPDGHHDSHEESHRSPSYDYFDQCDIKLEEKKEECESEGARAQHGPGSTHTDALEFEDLSETKHADARELIRCSREETQVPAVEGGYAASGVVGLNNNFRDEKVSLRKKAISREADSKVTDRKELRRSPREALVRAVEKHNATEARGTTKKLPVSVGTLYRPCVHEGYLRPHRGTQRTPAGVTAMDPASNIGRPQGTGVYSPKAFAASSFRKGAAMMEGAAKSGVEAKTVAKFSISRGAEKRSLGSDVRTSSSEQTVRSAATHRHMVSGQNQKALYSQDDRKSRASSLRVPLPSETRTNGERSASVRPALMRSVDRKKNLHCVDYGGMDVAPHISLELKSEGLDDDSIKSLSQVEQVESHSERAPRKLAARSAPTKLPSNPSPSQRMAPSPSWSKTSSLSRVERERQLSPSALEARSARRSSPSSTSTFTTSNNANLQRRYRPAATAHEDTIDLISSSSRSISITRGTPSAPLHASSIASRSRATLVSQRISGREGGSRRNGEQVGARHASGIPRHRRLHSKKDLALQKTDGFLSGVRAGAEATQKYLRGRPRASGLTGF